jgi:hypothetical protein
MVMVGEKEVMAILGKEQAAFEAQREELEREHNGEWVVFHDEQLAGVYPDLQAAAKAAVTRFGRGPYLIEQVGTPPAQIRSFLHYTPVKNDAISTEHRPQETD